MRTIPALIAGEEVTTGTTFTVVDPSTGTPFAEATRCGTAQVDDAVEAARSAFGFVRGRSAEWRAGVLRQLAALIRRDADRLADLECQDVGKPLRQARTDVAVTARYFDYYAGILQALHGDTLPQADGMVAFTRREPFGVTAHITPWNYPLQMTARTLAPALAAGNCCVLKPAEDTPVTAVEIARLALEAGFPPGMLNVVPGFGPEAGAALAGHPGIDHISFTGSRPVGTAIAQAAAANVVPVVLELGGKSPNIVFEDADLGHAVPLIVSAIIQNCGQTCSAGSRVLVHESVHGKLVAAVRERFEALRIGPGAQDPDLGPLISDRQRARVASLVEQGRREAVLVTGGDVPDDERLHGGFFYRPTLFDHVPATAAVAQEEIFGPVLSVTPFRDDTEAVALANGTEYGLVAAVWTRDIGRAHRLADEVCAGQVFVNTYGAAGGVELPFGGWKRSGYGREKGFEGLLGYTQTKTVVIGVR
ncbi:aldehyde dehydrogenase family protein [Streptomyces sp. VNUA24]|uniref:aldehyde dehydrogenase family protein n=1 Tax=Streptomyces sp. VNUA24 TaxID=3031131 RepID=UPI0023B79FE4|nr:aldehyde dehydrogenase family protein [Streptomyces sp. VNUA24]WEH19689.1 aldehyde dehydrogenase family protein [Streptomyces sp. VNUA24]